MYASKYVATYVLIVQQSVMTILYVDVRNMMAAEVNIYIATKVNICDSSSYIFAQSSYRS